MVAPIRIAGATGGGYTTNSGLLVEYESPSGKLWELYSKDGVKTAPVFVLPGGLSGLDGTVEWNERESVMGLGVRKPGPRDFRIPPKDISLRLGMRAPLGELEQLSRRWRRDWSHARNGKLIVRSVAGGRFWAHVTNPTMPDWETDLSTRRYVETTVTCRHRSGYWFGKTQKFTGATVVRVPGDEPLSPSCRLVWDGRATSFRPEMGTTITLPAVTGGTRYINLDRGMMGQVTKPDGTVDTLVWSALQGLVLGVSLTPYIDSPWILGDGLTLEVTPRFISPWR